MKSFSYSILTVNQETSTMEVRYSVGDNSFISWLPLPVESEELEQVILKFLPNQLVKPVVILDDLLNKDNSIEIPEPEIILEEPYVEPEPLPPVIPSIVSMRQARLALLSAGLLQQVTAAIDSLPSPDKEAAQIEWEYSQEVNRNQSLVTLLASSLGLTEEDLDNLFTSASLL
jgi:hypothetical protein